MSATEWLLAVSLCMNVAQYVQGNWERNRYAKMLRAFELRLAEIEEELRSV